MGYANLSTGLVFLLYYWIAKNQEYSREIDACVPPPNSDWKPLSSTINSDNFSATLKSHPDLAIHFWAPWEGYSQILDRAISEIRDESKFHFVACNNDDPANFVLAEQLSILNFPTLVVFADGVLKETIVGVYSANQLRIRLNKLQRRDSINRIG